MPPSYIQCSTSKAFYLKARPKPISGRTSYLRVRLEFHRYPQVIPSRFLVSGFGPPFCVTKTSTCSRLDHSVSGLLHHTMSPYSDSLSLRLRLFNLTSHDTITRRFILQKAYFTPLPGFFSPFPLGTCSLSVTREYLALRDGPRWFRQDYTCPAVLRIPYRVYNISFTGLSPTMV